MVPLAAGGPLRVAFAGTPDFALAPLEALATSPHRLVGVWTQPDRPAGRGRKLAASPVKERALALDLVVYQPPTFKDAAAQEALRAARPDVMVVVAYGLLLPKAVLAIPAQGCLNIHASLLPRWRGAAPIQRALLAGDHETGISIMQMDRGLDSGDVLLQRSTPIGAEDTAQTMHDRLAMLGAEAILEALAHLRELPHRQQDEMKATYAAKLSKEEALLDWTRPAEELARCVRAYDLWPVAYTLHQGGPLRIFSAAVLAARHTATPGTVVAAGRDGVDVACGEGVLRLLAVQPAGRRRMAAADFANARGLVGVKLG